MTIPVFLIGGGWNAEIFPDTFGRFISSATRNGERRIAIVLAEEEGADSHELFLRFFEAFGCLGLNLSEAVKVVVSKGNVLTKEKLGAIKPTGIFVCGGLTPAYFDALCGDKNWLGFLTENEIPYCGFSAGASIASAKAIIGGWQREIENRIVQIADENAGEDLDLLTVGNGLGLVDFSVDVHATQWGTLSRLIHAVDSKMCGDGFAIDEDTMLEIYENKISVRGAGNVYRVKNEGEKSAIGIFQAGAEISIS